MSDFTAIALIIATFFPTFFCFNYVVKLANDAGEKISTGVLRGIPIPKAYRGIMLYQIWIGYVVAAVACGILGALLSIRIAASVTDGEVSAVAHVAAMICAVGALGLALNALVQLHYLRSAARQVKAD